VTHRVAKKELNAFNTLENMKFMFSLIRDNAFEWLGFNNWRSPKISHLTRFH